MRFRGVLKRLHMRSASYINMSTTESTITFPKEVDVKYFKAEEGTFSIIMVPFTVKDSLKVTLGLVVFKNTPIQRFVYPQSMRIRLERSDTNTIIVYGYRGCAPSHSYKLCEFNIGRKRSKD